MGRVMGQCHSRKTHFDPKMTKSPDPSSRNEREKEEEECREEEEFVCLYNSLVFSLFCLASYSTCSSWESSENEKKLGQAKVESTEESPTPIRFGLGEQNECLIEARPKILTETCSIGQKLRMGPDAFIPLSYATTKTPKLLVDGDT